MLNTVGTSHADAPSSAISVGDAWVQAPVNALLTDLAERGWSEQRRFLPDDWVEALRAEAERQWEAGEYHRAGVGSGDEHRVVREVRGDSVRWLDPRTALPTQRAYPELLERLRVEVNRNLFLGLFEVEAHASRYPSGAHYDRHLDRFVGSDARVLTCVLYLNDAWLPGDGGELSLETTEDDVRVLPRAGTLASFVTEGMWHAVLPATRPRQSITTWFRQRPIG